jgi:hypothetical protein
MKYRPTGGRRLEPGEYVAQLTSAHEGVSVKGDQTLELTLTVDGVDIKDRLYNTEAAAWRMKQMRNAFGFADDAAEVEFAPETMVGKLARVRLEFGSERTSGKYIGKKFLEVAEYLAPSTKPQAEPEEADEIPF